MRPQRDEAPALAGAEGFKGQERDDDRDSATAKLISTAIARAALLGIEAVPLAAGAWLMRNTCGSDIGIVYGIGGLTCAVAGFELAVADARELVNRLRRTT